MDFPLLQSSKIHCVDVTGFFTLSKNLWFLQFRRSTGFSYFATAVVHKFYTFEYSWISYVYSMHGRYTKLKYGWNQKYLTCTSIQISHDLEGVRTWKLVQSKGMGHSDSPFYTGHMYISYLCIFFVKIKKRSIQKYNDTPGEKSKF